MRDYGTIRTTTWTGETGRRLRQAGCQVRLLYHYLKTCPSSNMIGVYYVPQATVAHEIGCSIEGAREGLRSLTEMGLAFYDESTEYVFVPNMAAEEIGDRLKPGDKRIAGIKHQLDSLRNTPFFKDFLNRYAEAYHLQDVRQNEAPPEGLLSPSVVPPEPRTGTRTGTRTKTGTKTGQGQERETTAPPSADAPRSSNGFSSNGDGHLFDLFWAAYPKKSGKGTVRKWFGKKKPTKELVEKMLATIKIFRGSSEWQDKGGQYIPMPSKWLNEERWDDEPSTQGVQQHGLSTKDYHAGAF